MRFVLAVWVLILTSLLLFTLVVFAHETLVPDYLSFNIGTALVLGAWAMGVTSAAALHVLYLRAERLLRQAARDETVVQLAGAVAHELNQPLTVVISSAELIARRNQSIEEIEAMALRMADASHRMADIIGKLQAATCYSAKPYVGSLKIVDLDRAS